MSSYMIVIYFIFLLVGILLSLGFWVEVVEQFKKNS